MAQSAPFWHSGLTWSELVDRYGTGQADAQVSPAIETAAAASTATAPEQPQRRDRRIAELRRAIVLGEVLGPPRALRGERGRR